MIFLYPLRMRHTPRNVKKQLFAGVYKDDWLEMVGDIPKTVFTAQQLEMVKSSELRVRCYIDYRGNIVKVTFMISKELFQELQEVTLKKLYNALRDTKINLNTVKKGSQVFGENNYFIMDWWLNKLM